MQKNTNEARDAALDELRKALRSGGYVCEDKVREESPFGEYKLPIAARDRRHDKRIAIGFQYQEGGGTAEQKVAWHLLCLAHISSRRRYRDTFFVWAGENWKSPPTNEIYNPLIVNADRVRIMSFPAFCTDAQAGRL